MVKVETAREGRSFKLDCHLFQRERQSLVALSLLNGGDYRAFSPVQNL
jgi:hypothetical protein